MGLVTLVCPHCHGHILISTDKDIGKCENCGNQILITKDISIIVSKKDMSEQIVNYIKMMNVEFNCKRYKSALDYAKKIIDLNESIPEAWYYTAASTLIILYKSGNCSKWGKYNIEPNEYGLDNGKLEEYLHKLEVYSGGEKHDVHEFMDNVKKALFGPSVENTAEYIENTILNEDYRKAHILILEAIKKDGPWPLYIKLEDKCKASCPEYFSMLEYMDHANWNEAKCLSEKISNKYPHMDITVENRKIESQIEKDEIIRIAEENRKRKELADERKYKIKSVSIIIVWVASIFASLVICSSFGPDGPNAGGIWLITMVGLAITIFVIKYSLQVGLILLVIGNVFFAFDVMYALNIFSIWCTILIVLTFKFRGIKLGDDFEII